MKRGLRVTWCLVAMAPNWIEGLTAAIRWLAERGGDRYPELKIEVANRTLLKLAGVPGVTTAILGLFLALSAWT
jgi:hypothetical protein